MSKEAQQRLIDNIVNAMRSVPQEIQQRQIAHFLRADRAYGEGVAHGVQVERRKGEPAVIAV